MNKKEIAKKAIETLEKLYPEAICSLDFSEPYQLIIATRLAAQCTDARVNLVTPHLFSKYKSLKEFAVADVADVEEIIRSCGFYKTKAKDICEMAKILIEKYDGVLPDTVEELIKLPGVGRKTANLIVGDIYKKPAIVCDTHCIRISGLLGLTTTKNPLKTEMELLEILPPEKSNDFCHRLVLHGRAVCKARTPNCKECELSSFCEYGKKQK